MKVHDWHSDEDRLYAVLEAVDDACPECGAPDDHHFPHDETAGYCRDHCQMCIDALSERDDTAVTDRKFNRATDNSSLYG